MEEEKQKASDGKTGRNIVEMLRDDQASGSKKNWKAFRDKLRLKRTGKAWTSSLRVPTSDMPIYNNNNNNNNNNKSKMMTRRGSWRYEQGESDEAMQPTARLLPMETNEENEQETNLNGNNDNNDNEEEGEGDQVLSLMALLSTDGSSYIDDVEQHEQHVENIIQHDEEVVGECNLCNGCKGKCKGTELGLCGHMFCKQCVKDLHVTKGNCPTCNDFILEILDIF